jgi:hypothetical protein
MELFRPIHLLTWGEPDKSGIMEECVRPVGILEAQSQLSIRFVERHCALDISARIQNTNLTGAKPRPSLGIVDGVVLCWTHRLNAGSFKYFPAPTVRPDFTGTLVASTLWGR